jgi:hypothetical protein
MSQQPPFSSECPKCHRERVITTSPDELAELLESGSEIEGYCTACDESWSISTEERADLARALGQTR